MHLRSDSKIDSQISMLLMNNDQESCITQVHYKRILFRARVEMIMRFKIIIINEEKIKMIE